MPRPSSGGAPPAAHPVKVAHVASVDLSLRFLLLNQLASLRDAGYAVTGISASGPHVQALQERGIPHIPVRLTRAITPVADLAALWRLYRVMRRERFTIVHCHTPKAELLGQLAARLAGVPIVVDTFRGVPDRAERGRLRRWLIAAMARLAAARADLVLCQRQEAMDALLRQGLCPPDRVALLGNGIDIERFSRAGLNPHDVEMAREELGIKPSQPVIGFVGRLVREKGILDLLAAMREVRRRVPDAQLIVVGPTDPDKPDAVTPATARRAGDGKGAIFTGLRTDMPTLYALMDVFVLPSMRESFPRAPMEACAMGVPCVLTDIPGCREVVDPNRNGLLVPIGSPPAIADAIVTLLTNRDLADRMGRAARLKAIESFDEQRVFATVKAAYARLLSERSIGPVADRSEAPVFASRSFESVSQVPRS
jgi:glycosyltransferase involved in cell wall biosynthesis